MKILILGAGVIGVTSAYYLAGDGHEVTVVERQPGAGLETSFANAGEVSAGYAAPWSGPGVPLKALRWLFMEHGPLVIRPGLDLRLYVWLARLLRNCTAARYTINKGRMLRLAQYSRDRLDALRAETGIAYDEATRGALQLFRTAQQRDAAAGDIAVLRQFGLAFEPLDQAGCIAAEPALAQVPDRFVGGLRHPGDETGDCHLFTQRLAALASARGVAFRYATTIERLIVEADRVAGIATSAGTLTANAYVMALASFSPLLLAPLGIKVPIYPVKGYSLTLPVTDPAAAPRATVMDEYYKIAITRLGARIRVGGTAELAGYSTVLRPGRRAALERSVSDLFPRGGDAARGTFWTGLRPMTPDGTPVIGATRYRNLYLNTGHGSLGWTMACGSARLIADLIAGRKPEIEADDLSVARYA